MVIPNFDMKFQNIDIFFKFGEIFNMSSALDSRVVSVKNVENVTIGPFDRVIIMI